MNRGSLTITTAVAAMLMWQLLPMERDQEGALPQSLQMDAIEMLPPKSESAPVPLVAVRLPAPPLIVKTETAPEFNPENNAQTESTTVDEPLLTLTPLQPRPVIEQEQQSNKDGENKIEVNQDKQDSLQQGRVLLKILEHGKGPGIEITWPSNAQQREDLYQLFHHCFGMHTAIMNSSGLLFRLDTQAGQPWRPNLDRFSGFVRQPQGYLARQETSEAEQIARHHRMGIGTQPVRIFPRQADALLLGGLQQLLGAEYATARQIRGVYEINGQNLFISSISKDNQQVEGRIHLTPTQRCR